MTIRIRAAAAFALFCLPISLGAPAGARAQATTQETAVTTRASGTFQVQLPPLESEAPIGRRFIDKQFQGDLQGTSKGEMIAAMGTVEGSAAYSALEQVTGTLHGRSGTFYLQHTGVMDRGAQSLLITVVPDSGTGELTGLTGTMRIIIEGGTHSYEFDYALPATP
jgi:Protein of unknown function (DUF3224)